MARVEPKRWSIPFDVLSERAKVVMTDYGIADRNDIAFVAAIAWVLGIELEMKLEPLEAHHQHRETNDVR